MAFWTRTTLALAIFFFVCALADHQAHYDVAFLFEFALGTVSLVVFVYYEPRKTP